MWTRKVLQITTPRDTPKPCDYGDPDKIDMDRCFFSGGVSVRVLRRSLKVRKCRLIDRASV